MVTMATLYRYSEISSEYIFSNRAFARLLSVDSHANGYFIITSCVNYSAIYLITLFVTVYLPPSCSLIPHLTSVDFEPRALYPI